MKYKPTKEIKVIQKELKEIYYKFDLELKEIIKRIDCYLEELRK